MMTNRNRKLSVLALTRYDDLGASSRYRILHYLPHLSEHGIEVEVRPLLDNAYVDSLYQGHNIDVPTVVGAYMRRLKHIVFSGRYDLLWIEKEALPFAPGWLEILLLGGSTRYVLDYDDAVFHNYDRHPQRIVRRILGKKYDRIMQRAALVVAGNDYIAERAKRSGATRVEIVPTVVDSNKYQMIDHYEPDEPAFGWIGTPVTAKFLDIVPPILSKLRPDLHLRFVAIGSGSLPWSTDRVEVTPWSRETEVESLRSLSIGIMPLPDSPFERGKCGLKLLQYMAVGLPVIASPVGVNRTIVEPGVNGFLCETTDEWVSAIHALATDPALRRRMGQAGRQKVESLYSLRATAPRMGALLHDAAMGTTELHYESASWQERP